MMRFFVNIILLCLSVSLFSSCENNDSVGIVTKPNGDDIVVKTDTFHIGSSDVFDNVISAQADSMYLGEFYSPVYGSTKAELLVQVSPPEKYTFPSPDYKPTPDSLILVMYYKSWFGSSNTPLEISVYELTNKQTINYESQYLSNLNIDEYTDYSVLMGKKIVTSVDLSVSDSVASLDGYVPSVRYKFDNAQLDRFWQIAKEPHINTEDFLSKFGGMYITSKYGRSTIFNFFQIDLKLYYHYTYTKNGKDTIVNTSITYPANKEVRQLNKFSHDNIKDVVELNDSINYIKSAAGIHTKINLPIGRVRSRIKNELGNKKLHISGANIQVELADIQSGEMDLLNPSYLMLIPESEYDEFLKKYDVPTIVDTSAVIGYYSSSKKLYNIDISYYLQKRLRINNENQSDDEVLNLLLIPVELQASEVSNSGSVIISRIRPQSEVRGIRIRSGKNSYSPMRLNLLYAGF